MLQILSISAGEQNESYLGYLFSKRLVGFVLCTNRAVIKKAILYLLSKFYAFTVIKCKMQQAANKFIDTFYKLNMILLLMSINNYIIFPHVYTCSIIN